MQSLESNQQSLNPLFNPLNSFLHFLIAKGINNRVEERGEKRVDQGNKLASALSSDLWWPYIDNEGRAEEQSHYGYMRGAGGEGFSTAGS